MDKMPVVNSTVACIPMRILRPFEEQCVKNFDMTLDELSKSGGTTPAGIISIIDGIPWQDVPKYSNDSIEMLKKLFDVFLDIEAKRG